MLRNMLINVEQDPRWHPEGNVWVHSALVRKALEPAVELWREYASSHCFSLFPDITDRDMHVLKVAAWLHDIGKAAFVDDAHAIGHDRPETYGPFWDQLMENPHWRELLESIWYPVRYIIERHMFSTSIRKRMQNKWIGVDGCYHPDQDIRRALIFKMMDLIGRDTGVCTKEARAFIEGVVRAANEKKARSEKENAPPQTGAQVVEVMTNKGLSVMAIKAALQGMLKKGSISEEEYALLLPSNS